MSLLLRPRAFFARPSSSKLSPASAFLQLPPACRAFHASPRPQFLETFVTPAHALFEGIHSLTGLPWVYSIPLAALTIRTFISLPLSIASRRTIQKQRELDPVLQAWQHQLQAETMREVGHLGPDVAQKTLLQKHRRKRTEIYKRNGCPLSKTWLPIFQLPVFLAAVEALRMMAGTHQGLLGLIAGNFSSVDTPDVEIEDSKLTQWYEPGFVTGGALWFKDLTVADPEMRLPFMLSASMLLSLTGAQKQSIWGKRITRALATVAVIAGPMLLHMPSGVLVYWISSMLMAYGQNLALERFMPMKKPVVPCKPRHPLRIGRAMMDKKS
jgi:inner membrane protein COX18